MARMVGKVRLTLDSLSIAKHCSIVTRSRSFVSKALSFGFASHPSLVQA
ncbi:MAG: hypothetical protein F6K28_49765 [Microcoleus sp. SIO2G3]|nr:hypothetical protein [Microcoleus sp. SIO2G3]